MQFAGYSSAGAARIASVCVLTVSLGGCYTMNGGGSSGGGLTKPTTLTTPTTPTSGPFTSFIGNFTGKAVGSGGTTNQFTNVTNFDDPSGQQASQLNVDVRAGQTPATKQVFLSGAAPFTIQSGEATVESNGSSYRGAVVNGSSAYAVFSNTPGSRLDASLGSPSLQYAYAGVAHIGAMRAGTTGGRAFSTSGLFGGAATSDMPTSGKADYAGGFEGMENSALNDQPMKVSNISGKANLSADFAARTVRGRIDDVSNHSVGPIKQAAGYRIEFNGAITGSSFSGSSWLTRANSDAPLSGYAHSGNLQGGFFGPGATETAGGLTVNAADANKKMQVAGAFGAKKK
jgi:hypothetical protein